jgi:uncharacterized membrane protein YkvA (DUF1232 family)
VTWWLWLLVAVAAFYAALVGGLVLAGRGADVRAVARFVPDCLVLFRRLARDERVPRRHRLALVALVGYLAMPFDLVPDFVPVAGQLDDAIVVALVLRSLLRAAGPDVVREHWPGRPASVDALLRVAGARELSPSAR